jgi:hypothetical protein
MRKTYDMTNLNLLSEFIKVNYKGHSYTIEHFYYEVNDANSHMRYTTTELDQEFFDRLEQLHRDRKIDEILKKN